MATGLSAVPWYGLVLADLQNAQAGPLVVAMQGTALASGQTDPTPQVMCDTCDEILGAVGFSGRYTMDASQGTFAAGVPNLIPPNLKNFAVKRVIRTCKGRLNMAPNAMDIEDERTYQRTLQLLREGKYPVDVTNNPSGSNISVKPGLVTLNQGYCRHYQPWQLRNL
jgi:hypothetical protein